MHNDVFDRNSDGRVCYLIGVCCRGIDRRGAVHAGNVELAGGQFSVLDVKLTARRQRSTNGARAGIDTVVESIPWSRYRFSPVVSFG
jgi:hypothetical protein